MIVPKFRADFLVKSAVVLPDDSPSVLAGPDPGIEITLRNAPRDADGHVPALIAQVVGECTSIEEAPAQFRELLANQLDVMSFATQSTFMIDQCVRVLDWEPFQKTRRILPSQKFDAHYPPFPDLQPQIIATVQSIVRARPEKHLLRAMHYFRQGVFESELSDQFLRFWAVLEVLAEASKDVERVAIKCPKCQIDLFCQECQETPTRRPMATQAVRDLLKRIHAQGEQLFKLFAGTRNHLTHSGSISTLRAKTGLSLARTVDEAATAAWHAIGSMMPPLGTQVHFLTREGHFAHRELVFTADMVFEYRGDAAHPGDADIPKPQISLQTRFRPIAENPPEAPRE